ncbi:dynein light chain Tctex-type 5-B-like isoform X2 [Liolophura sinensis]
MADRDVARDRAAKLLVKRGSGSSFSQQEAKQNHDNRLPDRQRKPGSLSTVSFIDEPRDVNIHPSLKLENTYQLKPKQKFSESMVHNILKEVLESYLAEEKYEPELCKQMTKTISEVVKARVKEMIVPRYKVICLVHIGQLTDQGMRMGSRCLWDAAYDTFSSYEFRNNSIYAVGMVFGVYYE